LNDHAWTELLEEFRALGGVAENIRLGVGLHGRGLFATDPSNPVAIRVPENLLVESQHIIFRNGSPQVGPDAKIGERELAWLNRYLAEISWAGGGRTEVERMFAAAQELPVELRHRLTTEFRCGTWFGDVSDEVVQRHFLRARGITYEGRIVIPPVLEFANHGAAAGFDASNGLSLAGSFADEVLVEYSDMDALGIFLAWGFAFPSPVALSIALKGDIQSTPLAIARRRSAVDLVRGRWTPLLTFENGQQAMTFLLLGHERYPRLAKGIFYNLMREKGFSGAEDCFIAIQQANRQRFLGILAAIEGVDLPIARTLRMVAEYQLRAMTFSHEFP
jgi:hypothetical protein